MINKQGKLYGVGVGPGDPELITLKALRILQQADVVIAPKSSENAESLALNIVKEYLCDNTIIHELIFPMVKDNDTLEGAWEENKSVIISYLSKGYRVVFLTLGDPMLYSTFIYVQRMLIDTGYPMESVPGITSFCAAASIMNMPLAEGKEVLSIIPANNADSKVEEFVNQSDGVVFMKVNRNTETIIKKLDNKNYKWALISRCGFEDQLIIKDSLSIKGLKLSYFSTILAKK